MRNSVDDDKKKEVEDTTKYGEFIASYFCWNTLEEQKKKTEKLENITNNNEEENKSNR